MSKGSKIFLGICTFLPLILGISLVCMYIAMIPEIMRLATHTDNPNEFMPAYFSMIFSAKLFVTLGLYAITKLGLIIYYIIHVVKHGTKTEGEKIMWILLFIFIGTIPFIIYYFVKIVPEQPKNEMAQMPS